MFERFTDRARRAIVLAQDGARDMGHGHIQPEHLLVGLRQGEGLAADAMSFVGIDEKGLYERVSALYESGASSKKVNKVPFSVEAKKSLELALRTALELGHSYIGTEHLYLGVLREAESRDWNLDSLLGVSATDVQRRLSELLGKSDSSPALRSPGLVQALDRARAHAGILSMTTGDVLNGILDDPDSQVSRAFAQLNIPLTQMRKALDSVNLTETSDVTPAPQSVTFIVGDTTIEIFDPDIAQVLSDLTAEQLKVVIKRSTGLLRGDQSE